MARHPETVGELFGFYHEYVKLLYSSIQVENQMPAEVLFELNAAFDHLSRHWIYGEAEKDVVSKAYSHLKRSCLDIFKLRVKSAIDQSVELLALDTSLIDNGEFDRSMRQLVAEIKRGATEARKHEGQTQNSPDGTITSFELWEPVYEDCIRFERDFYHHRSLEWAKKKTTKISLKAFVFGLVTAFIGGAFSDVFLKDPLANWIKKVWEAIQPSIP